jgi:transposase-like protein
VFVSTEPSYRKPALRRRARAMRRQGRSVRAIAGELGVARSTASAWVRDIPLSEAQLARLEAADPVASHRRTGQLAWSRLTRDSRRQAQAAGRRLASRGDSLHQAGCMLFWAEGSRHRNRVTFTNADSDMVRFFLRLLRECYGVSDEQVGLSINCHLGNGLTLAEIEGWWLARLGLPPSCLRTPAVNRTSSASRRVRRPLLYGTARVVVHSTEIVQSIYGAIQEYAGCSRPEWAELGLERAGA